MPTHYQLRLSSLQLMEVAAVVAPFHKCRHRGTEGQVTFLASHS